MEGLFLGGHQNGDIIGFPSLLNLKVYNMCILRRKMCYLRTFTKNDLEYGLPERAQIFGKLAVELDSNMTEGRQPEL